MTAQSALKQPGPVLIKIADQRGEVGLVIAAGGAALHQASAGSSGILARVTQLRGACSKWRPCQFCSPPNNLITVAGGVLTVVGAVAYGTGNANLSLPTIFYGIPILLGGLALEIIELPPAKRVVPANTFKAQREATQPRAGAI